MLIIAINYKITTTIYTMDPDDISAGWKTVANGLPSTVSSSTSLVSMHKGQTAEILHYKTKEWLHYDRQTGRFVSGGTVAGIPELGNTANAATAVPAMYFPECHVN